MTCNGPDVQSHNGLTSEEAEALSFLLPLSSDYPNIKKWYLEKVVPGLCEETRLLLPIYREGKIAGLGIAKNDGLEKKICTVRVAPEYENLGLGVRIFDNLLKWLDTDHPNLTVSEGKLPKFSRLFDYYGFTNTSANQSVYIPGVYEFGFNETERGCDVKQDFSLKFQKAASSHASLLSTLPKR